MTTKKQKQTTAKPDKKAGKITKTMNIYVALKRPDGASIDDLVKITGWQKHSVRGFLSTTKKKETAFTIDKFTRTDGATAYRLIEKEEDAA